MSTITSAHAALATYSFTGVTANPEAPLIPVEGTFQFNDRMSGSSGVYSGAVTGFKLVFNNGAYTSVFAPGLNGVIISQNTDLGSGIWGDRWALMTSATGDELGGVTPYNFDLYLSRQGQGLFTNTDLKNPPSLSDLDSKTWRLYFKNSDGVPFAFYGPIHSLTAVPLPPAVLLFGAGLIALVGLGVGGLRNLRGAQS
ncbi:MAG: hypothetical protein HP496_10330 [Nitrospira sp.]|nr:hypothetical protein [Nitrospira sp.]